MLWVLFCGLLFTGTVHRDLSASVLQFQASQKFVRGSVRKGLFSHGCGLPPVHDQ